MPETNSPARRHSGRYILLGLFLAVGSCAYYLRYHTGQNAMAFDQARWLAFEMDDNGFSTRYKMVGDLLRRHQLVGMSRAEVESLLGPIEIPRVNDLYPYPGWHLGHKLSPVGMPFGTTLSVEFGADGRVVKVWNPSD